MTDTDMVIWLANDALSVQTDNYSSGHEVPAVDSTNAYTTTFVVDPTTKTVTFTSTRPLDTGSANSYIIPLDTAFPMIYAFLPDTNEV